LPERIVLSMPLDPYLSLKALAAYPSLSIRRLRQLIDQALAALSPCTASAARSLGKRGKTVHHNCDR
jgi:hypothetical protein